MAKFVCSLIIISICVINFTASRKHRGLRIPDDCPNIKPLKRVNYKLLSGMYYGVNITNNVGYKCALFNRVITGAKKFNISGDAITTTDPPQPLMFVVQAEIRKAQKPKAMYQALVAGSPTEMNEFFLDIDSDPENGYIVTYSCALLNNTINEILFVGARQPTFKFDPEDFENLLSKSDLTHLIPDLVSSGPECTNWKQ